MKDQLISFETAKLAKEKGFNEAVYGRYMFNPNEIESYDKMHRNSWDENYLAAPTQSLLQGWLRDVCGIVVTIQFTSFGQYWFNIDNKKKTGDKFDTYEQALEKGLQEALKLIKNNG
jgi:hypothetical protein